MKRNYTFKADGNEFHLRLNHGALKRLRINHPGMNPLQIVMSAIEDDDIMMEVLHEALCWDGATNPETDEEVFYDILVDAGVSGMNGFAEVIVGIATASGLLKKEDGEKTLRGLNASYSAVFDDMEQSEEDPEAKQRPTRTEDIRPT